jgi:transposase
MPMRKDVAVATEPLQAALGAELRASASARFMHKLHCVLLVLGGMPCAAVGRRFGESTRSVERWVRAYRLGGIEKLREDAPHPGRPPRLPESSIDALVEDLRAPPSALGLDQSRWTGSLLAAHIARRYGVQLGARQCQRLLRRVHRGA